MNIPEYQYDKVERLDTYPDLLLAPKEGEQLLPSNSVVLKTAVWSGGTKKKTTLKVNFTPGRTYTNKKAPTARTLKEQVIKKSLSPQLHRRSVLGKPTKL